MKKNLLLLLLTSLIKSTTEKNKESILVVTDGSEVSTDSTKSEQIATKKDNIIESENNIIEEKIEEKVEVENADTLNSDNTTKKKSETKKTLTSEEIANFVLVDTRKAKDESIISIFSTSKETMKDHKITIGVFNGKLSKGLKIGRKTVLKIRYNGETEDSGIAKSIGDKSYIPSLDAVKFTEVK